MSSFCPKCGAQIAEGAQFCSACGTSIQTETADQEWYYMEKRYNVDYKRGPMKLGGDGMISAIEHAEITEGTMVWREGLLEWMPAGKTEIGAYIQKHTPFLPQSTVSDKWLWAMAVVPWFSEITSIIAIVAGIVGILSADQVIEANTFLASLLGGTLLAPVIMNTIFWALDMREVKKHGFKADGWFYGGLILIPIYLFVRASKTTKNYAPGFVWCALFVLCFLL